MRGWAFFRELLGPPAITAVSHRPTARHPAPVLATLAGLRSSGRAPLIWENRQRSKSGQSFGCARRLGGRRGAVEAGKRRRIGVGGASADLSVAADVGGFCVTMD